jgi:hypothetical protein
MLLWYGVLAPQKCESGGLEIPITDAGCTLEGGSDAGSCWRCATIFGEMCATTRASTRFGMTSRRFSEDLPLA